MRHRGFRDPEHGIDIRFEGRVELLVRDVRDRVHRMLFRGVVDENVEPSEFARGIRDELPAEGLILQIAGDRNSLPTGGADQLDDLFGIRLFHWQIVDRHVSAFPSKGNCGSPPHAGIASGYQSLSSRELARPLVAGLTMIRLGCHPASKPRRILHLAGKGGPRICINGVLERAGVPRCRRRHGISGIG